MIHITKNIRGYASDADRRRAIHQLARRAGLNYFVPFHDVQSRYALQMGVADWVQPGAVHVDGGFATFGKNKVPRCSRPFVSDPYAGQRRPR